MIIIGEGDSVENIAHVHGHHWKTVWKCLDNEDLRAQRRSPHHLVPGDQLFVPERTPGSADCTTEQRHVFRRKGVPSVLRIFLKSFGEPRSQVPYVLTVDGRFKRGKSDHAGLICEPIPPDADSVQLTLDKPPFEQIIQLKVRALQPVSTDQGIRARLQNLGYAGPDSTSEELQDAIRAFQADNGQDPTGRLDDDLRNLIERSHGS